ncbi:MAG: DUF998 domain-containing protein [Acidimicrobiales bacterium]
MVRAFGVIALLAVSVQLVLLVTLHALPTGYNPVRDAISDYGVGRYRAYFWAQLIAGGTACIGIALALAELHPYVPTFVVVMQFLNAVARCLMPAFLTDQSGNRFETVKGTISHGPRICRIRGGGCSGDRFGGLLSHYPE